MRNYENDRSLGKTSFCTDISSLPKLSDRAEIFLGWSRPPYSAKLQYFQGKGTQTSGEAQI